MDLLSTALPIAQYRDQILATVAGSAVTIITAETGAGKSTQVPQYLLNEGYNLVVTQPRRLAARTVAERVAEEYGCPFNGIVGYRTATDRQDSAATRCLFVTDGLALVRELMGAGTHNVLVLDEVHEWNLNIEVLIAWARKRLGEEAGFKVVLMSATLEADRLAAYFGGAPIINVPGRLFPVEVKKLGTRLVDDVAELARAGRNVLVFQPGKAEIEATIAELTRLGVDAEILPLHGELSAEEQKRCFKRYSRSKVVVSTNVAQTSVTIDDIDAVVDSGMERRIELVDGVEGLYLKPISLADSKQRAGRAGRTKPGVYIDHCTAATRPEFPKAEILRTRLDQTVLRLAEAGFDMEELTFFHQPNESEIHDAKCALKALGCMSEDGTVTPIGRKVAKLPVSVQFGRMIVEADKFGVVGDVLTITAILEQGEITARPRDRYETPAWRGLCASERESDALAQLAVYNAAERMSKSDMVENGVFVKAFFKAKEIRRHLEYALRGKVRSTESTGKRDDIVRSLCSGMVDHLYQRTGYGWRNGEGVDRELNRDSVATATGDWLVGLPFDLEIKTRRGGTMTLRLIRMATKVNPRMLAEAAPQLVRLEEHLTPVYDSEKDLVVSTTRTFFNNHMIDEEKVPDGEHPEAAIVFARWLSAQSGLLTMPDYSAGQTLEATLRSNAARQERARQLNIRTGEQTFQVFSSEEVFERFVTALSGARRILEVVRPEALTLPALDEDKVDRVLSESPDTIDILESKLVVEYADDYGRKRANPRVKLSEELVKANGWIHLPDEGVCLPGGRSVEVVVSFGYYTTIVDTNIPLLKAKVRVHLNREQWDRWTKPEIEIPDHKVEDSVIPFEVAVYGQCTMTGQELTAYGTVEVNTSRWYANDPWFMTVWYRDISKAHNSADNAAKKLTELKVGAKAAKEREVAKARAEAETARAELKALVSNDLYDANCELHRKAETRTEYNSPLPLTVEQVRAWTVETKAITAAVQTAISELIRKREEEAESRKLAEAEKKRNESSRVDLLKVDLGGLFGGAARVR